MDKIHPVRFIHAFLEHVNTIGIFDEFDPEENMMRTSEDVQDLIAMAYACLPDKVENSAKAMRELTDVERDAYIGEDIENVIIDMRDEFATKMAENGGAAGVLRQLVEAQARGDHIESKKLMQMAKEFTKRET